MATVLTASMKNKIRKEEVQKTPTTRKVLQLATNDIKKKLHESLQLQYEMLKKHEEYVFLKGNLGENLGLCWMMDRTYKIRPKKSLLYSPTVASGPPLHILIS